MSKIRVPVPVPVQRMLFVQAGYCCSMSRCGAGAALEIHHIDEDPSNNDPENLLVLCPNHHAQATQGKIDRLACIQIKKQLATRGSTKIDHKKLATLIAQTIASSQWPDPIQPDSSLGELAQALDREVGAKAELITRCGETMAIWIQAGDLKGEQAKALVLAIACVASSVRDVTRLEIGFSDTQDFVRTIGGPGAGAFRVRFESAQALRVAKEKEVPADFWGSAEVLVVSDENTPFATTLEVPFRDFERRAL